LFTPEVDVDFPPVAVLLPPVADAPLLLLEVLAEEEVVGLLLGGAVGGA
jgi:hypothetical protein